MKDYMWRRPSYLFIPRSNMTHSQFIKMVKDECKKNGVRFFLSKRPYVTYDRQRVNGYFIDIPDPVLAVATGQTRKQWFKVLIHEYCHMLQWLDGAREWHNSIKAEPFWPWFAGNKKLSSKQAHKYAMYLVDVELDCERRVLKMIKDLDLPIDAGQYARNANAYVYFYHLALKHRRWYDIGQEPYNTPKLVALMPAHLRGSHRSISKKMVSDFEKHLGWRKSL